MRYNESNIETVLRVWGFTSLPTGREYVLWTFSFSKYPQFISSPRVCLAHDKLLHFLFFLKKKFGGFISPALGVLECDKRFEELGTGSRGRGLLVLGYLGLFK